MKFLTYVTVSLALVSCQSKKADRSQNSDKQAEKATESTNGPRDAAPAPDADAGRPDAHAAPAAEARSILIPAGPYTSCVKCPEKHRITYQIDAFRIAQSEVTNGEYQACVESGACRAVEQTAEPDEPVVNIAWADADSYCRFAGGRLPTATEWRKAAFPADPAQDGVGPMIGAKYDPCMVLVIGGHHDEPCTKGQRRKAPVLVSARDPAREFNNQFDRASHGDGLVFDLFGNVAEWVSDWYEVMEFLKPSTLINPQGAKAEDSTEKTICGGSFSANVGLLGGACRPMDAEQGYADVGFRCAWDVTESP